MINHDLQTLDAIIEAYKQDQRRIRGLRETTLHLLQSGVDMTVIAMWLGHEDIATTHQYIEADLEMKEAALKCMDAPSSKPVRFKAKDRLLNFLEGL